MLTESFIAATETVKPPAAHLSSNLKDVGVFIHDFQPQPVLRQGYKKSSTAKNCLAISNTHVFAAQVGKAVVNVYSRVKGNQEATIPFPQKISSLAYAEEATILVLGTQDGKLILWEVATGRVTTSSASHIEAVTSLVVCSDGDHVVSGSSDSTVHIWSLRKLVSIEQSQSSFSNAASSNEPVATFSQHRSSVQAIAVGHSRNAATNFVVSASEDKTCYIWNLATQQVLRTILLIQVPQCAVLDPADRAVYIGSKDGSVQQVSITEDHARTSILNNSSETASTPFQLALAGCFLPTSNDIGPAQCLAISYDGTRLLSGHYSGKVLQWDIAKRRQGGELTSLSGQSVTNLHMLRPDGFAINTTKFVVPAVVKPRLDLNGSGASHQGAIPAEYVYHAQVTSDRLPENDIETAMTSSGIPQAMIDAAVQALARSKTGGQGKYAVGAGNQDASEAYKIDEMEQELKSLRAQVNVYQKNDQERLERHLARMKRREALGFEKRQAFFTAKKAGRNGDEAMKPFMQAKKELDAESDEEAVRESRSNGQHVDFEMKG